MTGQMSLSSLDMIKAQLHQHTMLFLNSRGLLGMRKLLWEMTPLSQTMRRLSRTRSEQDPLLAQEQPGTTIVILCEHIHAERQEDSEVVWLAKYFAELYTYDRRHVCNDPAILAKEFLCASRLTLW